MIELYEFHLFHTDKCIWVPISTNRVYSDVKQKFDHFSKMKNTLMSQRGYPYSGARLVKVVTETTVCEEA